MRRGLWDGSSPIDVGLPVVRQTQPLQADIPAMLAPAFQRFQFFALTVPTAAPVRLSQSNLPVDAIVFQSSAGNAAGLITINAGGATGQALTNSLEISAGQSIVFEIEHEPGGRLTFLDAYQFSVLADTAGLTLRVGFGFITEGSY